MSQIDPKFFKPFIEGTLNTMKVQFGLSATGKPPFLLGQGPGLEVALAGVIHISGERFTGKVVLCFPEKVFLGLMERMLGEPFSEITPELRDGVAEILNIIYGQAKVALNQGGPKVEMAIPAILSGEELANRLSGVGKCFVLPFDSEIGEFRIEIHENRP
jgi:chemotaxis protein CheX